MKPLRSLHEFFAASLFRKIAGVLAVCLLVMMEATILLSIRVSTQMTWDNLREFAAGASADLAAKSAAPIRFSDSDGIAVLVDEFRALAGSRLEAVQVLKADGTAILVEGSFDDVSEEVASGFALTSDETVTMDVDGAHFVQAIPITAGEEATRVGTIAIVWSAETVLSKVHRQSYVIQGIGFALFVGIMVVMALLLRRLITRPLGEVGARLRDIVGGDHDCDIPGLSRTDELGRLAEDIRHTQTSLRAAKDLQTARDAEQAEREAERKRQQVVVTELRKAITSLSDHDLSYRIERPFGAGYEGLRDDFNTGMESLRKVMKSVLDNARTVESGAGELGSASDSLAQRTETQAAALEETSAALSEITDKVKSAADSAKTVEASAMRAREQTDASDSVVKQAVGAMAEIKDSSDKISNIVSLIEDIAFQTNLLALNAGVEAARAGEAGRGFAVVAGEVRSLAQRSAEAANDIKSLIIGSSEHVSRGVELVNRTGESLGQVSQSMMHISGLITDIAKLSAEQATSVSEIYSGVEQLDLVTQENAAMVEQSTAASQMLLEQATQLARQIATFQLTRESAQAAGIEGAIRAA